MTGAMNGGITVQACRSNETTRTLTHFTFAIVQIFALTVAVASVRTCVGQAVSAGKTSVTFANSLQIWINVERARAVSLFVVVEVVVVVVVVEQKEQKSKNKKKRVGRVVERNENGELLGSLIAFFLFFFFFWRRNKK